MRRRCLQWSGARSAGAGRWAFGILWHPNMYVLSGIFGVPFVLLSLPSGLIGTFGQEARPFPLSLDRGFSRHSIFRGVPSMRCRFGR